ncbi:class II aldolase/adducin family protein [Streptomyces sp. NPDC059740]|uniref:class II aldolase/adducin family protein n=1 Tax=Streptomyces sp. NPDC059740 TaxID=3346926 RepID=UPI0036679440
MSTGAATALAAAGRRLAAAGLSPGSSGNLSVRTPDGYLATPTGHSLHDLTPAGLSVLDLDGEHRAGPAPTKELPLHLGLYARSPQVAAVVHLHSVHAVAVACRVPPDPADVLPPYTPYGVMLLGRVPLLPYAPPGSRTLAGLAGRLPPGTRAALLANHGALATGGSLERAVEAAVELEETARLHLLLGPAAPVRPLTPAQCAELPART